MASLAGLRYRVTAAVALACFFLFTSCPTPVFARAEEGPIIESIRLSDDMRVARISFRFESGHGGAHLPESVTLLHERTGIRITFRLTPEDNGYTFYNYGLLLKKGDRVAVLANGFSPAFSSIE